MSDKSIREMADIEATQAALRDSIEATKQLAEKADTLLQQHRATLEQEASLVDEAPPPLRNLN